MSGASICLPVSLHKLFVSSVPANVLGFEQSVHTSSANTSSFELSTYFVLVNEPDSEPSVSPISVSMSNVEPSVCSISSYMSDELSVCPVLAMGLMLMICLSSSNPGT